jgi:hypothetical protein
VNVFFSGIGKGTVEGDERLGSPRFRLFSCHGNYFNYALKTIPLCRTIDDEFEIMLDSGAFTAWTKNEEVKIGDLIRTYGAILEKYGDVGRQFWLINLDKIPGSPGRTAGPKEIDECIRISDENYEQLVKEFGDIVLPVFHQGESERRLAEVEQMGSYINISPRNDVGERVRVRWAKEVHAKLKPETKTHGLAATGLPMMQDVPWHSVDSASWIMVASYGHIWWPRTMTIISISDDSPNRYLADKHYVNLDPLSQKQFEEYAEQFDMTIDQLRSDFVYRAIWNRLVQSEIYRAVPPKNEVVRPLQEGIFDL